MVLIYLVSGLIFIVQSRYRSPAVPYLCLLAGFAIYRIWILFRSQKYRAGIISLAAGGVLYLVFHFSLADQIRQVDRWQTATKIHYQLGARPLFQNGRFDQAITELDACLSLAPDFAPALNLRGKSRAVLGKYDEAKSDFLRVIALTPDLAQGYKNLGFVLLLQGDRATAKTMLENAQKLSPGDTKVKKALAGL